MNVPKIKERGFSVLEMIITLTVISSITVITIIMFESYNRNFKVYKKSNEYYSEKLRVSLCFNQVLYFYNSEDPFYIEYDDNDFYIKRNDEAYLEYVDGVLYNNYEQIVVHFTHILDINISAEDKYLKVELISDEFTEFFRVRWNQIEC